MRPIGVENIGITLDNDVAFGTDADLGLTFYFIGVDAGVIGRQGRLAAAFDFDTSTTRSLASTID